MDYVSDAAANVVPFREQSFREGSNELFVQNMFRIEQSENAQTPLRDVSIGILESSESRDRLLHLVQLSRVAGESIQQEKKAQRDLCQWYLQSWMEEKPGFCLDPKFRGALAR